MIEKQLNPTQARAFVKTCREFAAEVAYSLENDCSLNKSASAKLGFFVPATQSLQSPICSEGIEPIFERI